MDIKKLNLTSFDDVDRQLEILSLEKDISYQKLSHSVDVLKRNYTPGKLLGVVPKIAIDLAAGLSGGVKGVAVSYFLKRFLK